jgi:hypothetical protein
VKLAGQGRPPGSSGVIDLSRTQVACAAGHSERHNPADECPAEEEVDHENAALVGDLSCNRNDGRQKVKPDPDNNNKERGGGTATT